jgi:hypothetical protein
VGVCARRGVAWLGSQRPGSAAGWCSGIEGGGRRREERKEKKREGKKRKKKRRGKEKRRRKIGKWGKRKKGMTRAGNIRGKVVARGRQTAERCGMGR